MIAGSLSSCIAGFHQSPSAPIVEQQKVDFSHGDEGGFDRLTSWLIRIRARQTKKT
jgi:hypothetical protein